MDGSGDCSIPVSALFFKRFLQRPFQVASIIPSSKAMVERVASKMDFSQPRVIAEYGPGEGVHSREIARRMSPDSQLLLFELDRAFARDLERQFADDATRACDSWRCGLFAIRVETSRDRLLRLHPLRHSVQHS